MKIENNGDVVMSWGELANLTHETQVKYYNFCMCEDNEGNENPYSDCPTGNETKEIKIETLSHEETGWKRRIHFIYKGDNYGLTLFWDEFNGYEIYWKTPDLTPDWVIEWDSKAHNDMSFEHYLDDLTWEMK